MTTAPSADWDSLRRSVRNLENELDQRISAYSKHANQLSTGYYASSSSSKATDAQMASSSEEGRQLESEINDMLEKLGKAVDEMTVILDTRGTSSTSAMSHTLTRHREILTDYARDARRTTAQIREAEKRSNLLGSVRAEISSFKQRQEGQSDTDMLLGERSRIDESNRMTDQVLEQAYATRYEFAQQRGMLGGVNSRMKGVISQVPGINSLLSMINSRRRRETFILSSVTGICTLILLWYVFG